MSEYLTNCCNEPFYEETDICSACKEHADPMEEEDCCESSANGFKCACINRDFCHSQQAEDDGYGDWKHDQEQDRKFEERGGDAA